MLTKNDIRNLQKKYGFAPNRRLGQNFLIDSNIKDKILKYADLRKEDTILEIGAGLGQLTFDLAKATDGVIAIEFDRKLFSVLSELAEGIANIKVIHGDFLKTNLEKLIPPGKKVKVIANLPYYISTPIILKLFSCDGHIDFAILTVQKEVADRLIASPSSREYGSLTLFAEFHAEIKRVFNIKRNSFYPSPKIDSTVIGLKMRAKPPIKVRKRKDLFGLIRAGFSKRRKTLPNALLSQNFMGISRERLSNILADAGISENARAEELGLSDFARIANLV